ncbi:DEAD/DEAH box helicase [Kurthia sibirica]|uniref:ATP-dependent helicase n=1 Tax=Kurthia sibirica TaxID=202750 RepID=A0A2U3AKW9_9BACL|nr:DEAD/DEAH box helicase [Kurthia sibirica]PWI25196.1 ATP-dependent helicase [Kurthia sibirica]GEK33285.1 ATP-dependent helicase [Kurthia sibirica]
MKTPTAFTKNIGLTITQNPKGLIELTGFDVQVGRPLRLDEWTQQLFFAHEQSFYGLTINAKDEKVFLTPLEFVEIFSEQYAHPYVKFNGRDEEGSAWIDAASIAARHWFDKDLWSKISIADDIVFNFETTSQVEHLLKLAIAEKLQEAGLGFEDIHSLLPFFRNGGWPITKKNVADEVIVGLRLREPEEGFDHWILETVLRSTTKATYWAPPLRKRPLRIEHVLPTKWVEYADGIQTLQEQMIHLLDAHDYMKNADETVLLYRELADADIRQFLRSDFMLLQALGFEIVLPAWLKEVKESRMKVRASASTASNYKSAAGLQEILTFDWKLSLNGQEVSVEDFQQMVSDNREFIRAGTEWVRVDAAWMHEIQKLMDKAENEDWTVKDILFQELPAELELPLDVDDDDDRDDPILQMELQSSLRDYIQKIVDKKGLPEVPISPSLQADLRPYQQEGFEWLAFMREQNFGAVLADDMGLGKTIQLISYLLHVYENSEPNEPTIIICPTSVLGNWQKEIERFAPSLTTHLLYGPKRLKGAALEDFITNTNTQIILTTYGTITQDIESLELLHFANITLDEAQNIKNMNTKQSKAIRRLQGSHNIALTGTPVENRLSELWAIFDFIYRGYLGSFSRFQEEYIAPIERDDSEVVKERLRKKIQPFLLRRTKQDPALQLNLPEKLEQKEYCALTEEQAVLYESFIQETMHKLETLTGFERKGLILKMLNKLKQLCNHPALYLKEPFEDASSMVKRSEKIKNIVSMGAEIVENGEQCLIFTQYIGMGHLLQHCFSELYDVDVPFLTGSMPKQQRDHFVESFQKGEFPIFILSLKAGGTGLNLTAANHVLHADRWWNPAVENQATDRAYRIGQTQFVHVHKFITTGTVEEKIDTLLTEKQSLSEDLIQSSQWITELKDEEIRDLLSFNF